VSGRRRAAPGPRRCRMLRGYSTIGSRRHNTARFKDVAMQPLRRSERCTEHVRPYCRCRRGRLLAGYTRAIAGLTPRHLRKEGAVNLPLASSEHSSDRPAWIARRRIIRRGTVWRGIVRRIDCWPRGVPAGRANFSLLHRHRTPLREGSPDFYEQSFGCGAGIETWKCWRRWGGVGWRDAGFIATEGETSGETTGEASGEIPGKTAGDRSADLATAL